MEQLLWEHIERARDLILNVFLFGPIDDIRPQARLTKALFYTRDAGIGLEASVTTVPSRVIWINLISEASGNRTCTPGGKRLRSLVRRCRDDQPQSELLPGCALLLLCVHGWLRGWSPVSIRLPRFTDRLMIPSIPQTPRPYTTCVELAFYHVLVLVYGAEKVLRNHGDVDAWISNEVEGSQNKGWKHSRCNHTELLSGAWSNLKRLLVVTTSVQDRLVQLGMRDVFTKNGPGPKWVVSFVHPSNLHVRIKSTIQHTAIYVQTRQQQYKRTRYAGTMAWPTTSTADQRLTYLLTTHLNRMPICRHTVFALGGSCLRRFVHQEPSLGRCMLHRRSVMTQSSLDAMHAVEAMAEGWLPLDPIHVHQYGVKPRISLELLHTGKSPPGITDRNRVDLARRKYPSPRADWSDVIQQMIKSPSLVQMPLDVLARKMFRCTPKGRLYTASGRLFGGKHRFETLCLNDTLLLQSALIEDKTGTCSMLILFAIMRKWQYPLELRKMNFLCPRKTRMLHASTGDAWLHAVHKSLLSIVTNPTPVHRLTRLMFRTVGHRFYPTGGRLFGGRRRFESLCPTTFPILEQAMAHDQLYTYVLLSLYAGLRQWSRPREIQSLIIRHPKDVIP